MNTGFPLHKEDYTKCVKLLETIEADPGCEPFLFPVQWQGKLTTVRSLILNDYDTDKFF